MKLSSSTRYDIQVNKNVSSILKKEGENRRLKRKGKKERE
jgi:hypothetical protein